MYNKSMKSIYEQTEMGYTIYLNDEDGGERGTVEGSTIQEALDALDSLDGCDAMERGCMWLGAYDITVDETGETLDIEYGRDGKYHLTSDKK